MIDRDDFDERASSYAYAALRAIGRSIPTPDEPPPAVAAPEPEPEPGDTDE